MQLSTKWKIAISMFVSAHLLAVFAAPWSLPPSSDLSQELARSFRPYLEITRLTAGYRYFAPQPGPSHIIRYSLTMADGSRIKGQFPDINEHWPRLYYHRHFMLTEYLNAVHPEEPPPGTDRNSPDFKIRQMRTAELQKQFTAYAQSYAQHLIHVHGATKATLTLVRHEFPHPVEFAPQSYPIPGEPERLPGLDPLHDPRFFHVVAEYNAVADHSVPTDKITVPTENKPSVRTENNTEAQP